jgi:ARG/rhodanese/phosphatase superfamily protein
MTKHTLHPSAPTFDVGDPKHFGALTVLPLTAHVPPRIEYVGLDEALARGAVVRELSEAGSVEALVFENKLGEAVLLYEGEELVGAKQNRIVQRTALIPPKTVTALPVHCVEQGRWAYRTRIFSAAPRAATPEVRRAKGSQGLVWQAVAEKNARLDVHAPTGSAEAAYDVFGGTIDEYLAALPRVDGQCGVIAAIGGRVACLDYVGRADVFAGLHAKLLRGYALDALEHRAAKPVRREAVDGFLRDVAAAQRRLAPAIGLGSESRFSGPVLGIELAAHGEVVALTAFPA